MPTRIAAGVGVSLLFIIMIPIDCRITNFFLYLYYYNIACSTPQAPWSLTFWLVYEEVRVLAGLGNF